MRPTAYLVEYSDGERAAVEPFTYYNGPIGSRRVLAALECVRSFDHGARTAEELDMDRCADGAARIMSPLLALILPAGAPWHPGLANELAMACIVEEHRVEQSSFGLWHCNDPDDAQGLHELWDYRVEPALGDAGYIVESSADMTWIYRPIGE